MSSPRKNKGQIMGVRALHALTVDFASFTCRRESYIKQLYIQFTYNFTYDGIPDMVLNVALFVLPCSVFGSR